MRTRLHHLLAVASLLASSSAMAGPDHVVPYAGVIDKNGAPFTGPVSLNFGLFNCPNGVCPTTPLWVASGAQTSFPPAGANGVNVTSSGGQFSVLLGDTGQTALPSSVQQSTQLHVRIAIKASDGSWVALGGAQRVAPVARAISAEEANSFTVRQNLAVAGSATVAGALSADTVTSRVLAITEMMIMNDREIRLRGAGDPNHALDHRNVAFGAFGGFDGPALYGFSGGVLGTTDGGERHALGWNTSGVAVRGNLAAGGTTSLQGTSMTTLNVSGATTVSGQIAMNDAQLRLRNATDANHGLRFDGAIDGPTLWGNSGGSLGTGIPGAQRLVLRWTSNGNVNVDSNLNAASYSKDNDPLFIICERNVNEGRGGGTQSITWTAAQCGGRLPSANYVGAASNLSVCSGANTFDFTPTGVTWFVNGSGCGGGSAYNIRGVYLRR